MNLFFFSLISISLKSNARRIQNSVETLLVDKHLKNCVESRTLDVHISCQDLDHTTFMSVTLTSLELF